MGNVTTKLIEAYAEVNINEKKKLDPVDAKALNNEASEHAYNPSGREKEVQHTTIYLTSK